MGNALSFNRLLYFSLQNGSQGFSTVRIQALFKTGLLQHALGKSEDSYLPLLHTLKLYTLTAQKPLVPPVPQAY